MVLNEQDFHQYMMCPTKYHIDKNTKLTVAEEPSMQKLLMQVANYFFLQLLNGKVPTIKQLQTKWDSVCEANQNYIDSKKNINGWSLILKLVRWAEEEQIIIGDVNTPFSLIIDGHQFNGIIPAVLIKPNKQIIILDLSFSEKMPDKLDIDTKLKYSIYMEGFKSIYGRYPDFINVHSVKYNQDIITMRGPEDYARMRSAIKNICLGIQHNIFYPRETIMCRTCSVREYCKYWHD